MVREPILGIIFQKVQDYFSRKREKRRTLYIQVSISNRKRKRTRMERLAWLEFILTVGLTEAAM